MNEPHSAESACWHYGSDVIKTIALIGGGQFGKVYKGLLGSETVALKTINGTDTEDFKREAAIARECNHPNVLRIIGICIDLRFIITEFMQSGNLKEFLRTYNLSLIECVMVARKIASGMKYLCNRHIVHCNLAARNILIGETIDTIKIADFGLSRELEGIAYYSTQKSNFAMAWTAPEAFVIGDSPIPNKLGRISHAADVWSYGVVLFEIYSSGDDPYREIGTRDLYSKLTEEGIRLLCPIKCPIIKSRPTSLFMKELSNPEVPHRSQNNRNDMCIEERRSAVVSLSKQLEGERSLKSFNGKYLRAWRGPSNILPWFVDMAPHCYSCELWYIEDRNGKVLLRAHCTPKYLRALSSGAVDLVDRREFSDLCVWNPIKNEDDSWSLQSIYGTWLSALPENGPLCTMNENLRCEQFRVESWKENQQDTECKHLNFKKIITYTINYRLLQNCKK